MTTDPANLDEIDLVRNHRRHLAKVPPGLQARIEERLWQQVLVEEAKIRKGRASGARRRRTWGLPTFARQGAMAAAAATLVVALIMADSRPGGTPGVTTEAAIADPISVAMRAIAGASASSAQEVVGVSDVAISERPAPLVAGSTMIVFASGDTMPLSQIAAGPAAMSPHELSLLPADERLLMGLLRAAGGATTGHDRDFEPFRLAALYLSDPRVPPAVRIALMRMIRVTDGISIGGGAVDVFGRPGVLVARLDRTSGLRQQYLLDEDNGRLLEHREYVVVERLDGCPAGTVVAMSAYDSTGFQVPQDQAPYGSWPDVVPECDPATV